MFANIGIEAKFVRLKAFVNFALSVMRSAIQAAVRGFFSRSGCLTPVPHQPLH